MFQIAQVKTSKTGPVCKNIIACCPEGTKEVSWRSSCCADLGSDDWNFSASPSTTLENRWKEVDGEMIKGSSEDG
jgi:hypothetical protein